MEIFADGEISFEIRLLTMILRFTMLVSKLVSWWLLLSILKAKKFINYYSVLYSFET